MVAPVIDGWAIPNIESIRALERRRFASLPVVGLAGTLRQDMGAHSVAVEIVGSIHSTELRDQFFDNVRKKFQAGSPVSFVADIVTATEVDKVLIEELTVVQSNDYSEALRYRIVLSEYVEPPPPPGTFDELGAELGAELDLLADLGLDGLELPSLLIDIPTLGNPVEPVRPALEGLSAATAPLGAALTDLAKVFD